MNRTAHVTAGVAVSAAAAAFAEKPPENLSELFALLIAGGTGARLPDLIEPASNPNHRAFFHSAVVLTAAVYCAYRLWQWEPEDDAEKILKWLGLGLTIGYVSHLALDATTPKSIPLIR